MHFPVNPARTFDYRELDAQALTTSLGGAVATRAENPVLLAVDGVAEALGEVSRELRQRYGDDYRVVCEGSAEAAIERLRDFEATGDEVALILADQWMPEMSGT